jgi:uncharacterized pyridoxamine 5'-phosphate oxidase family protein
MIEQAFQFLRQHNEGVLATVSGDRPQTRAFQAMKVEDTTLYFATSAKKAVYSQLQTNPNAEFIVLADKVSVRCGGTVAFDVDDDTQRWIYDHNEVLRRLYDDYRQMVYFRLPVEQLEYYDLRPTPPIVLHANLVDGTVREGFKGGKFSN